MKSVILRLMAPYYFICFIVGFILGIISKLLYLGMITTLDIKNLADAFQAVSIGIGALVSAATFAPALLKMMKHNRLVKQYRSLYPVSEMNSFFKLANNPHRGRGHVYLLDNRSMTTHHVENPETMKDLLFDWGQVKDVTIEEYDRYKGASNIDTKIE